MKNKILIIVFMTLLSNAAFSQSAWTTLSGVSGFIRDLHFMNNQTGWVAGSTGVYKTTNGGANWTLISSSNEGPPIYFLNESTGFAENKRTSNGGINWITLSGISSTEDITFTGNTVGFIVGGSSSNGSIWKTTDAGITWSLVHYQTIGKFFAVHFINFNTGWVCGQDGMIFKSTNAGDNWTSQSFNTSSYRDIWFTNENTGWVCWSGSTQIRKTTNGGANWQSQTLPNFGGVAMNFITPLDGRLVGSGGLIMRTVNGGANWFMETSPTAQNLHGIFFSGNDTGYICGENGTLLKTINGGFVTGIQTTSNDVPEYFSLVQNFPNPFNPVTNIKFSVPQTGVVKLTVFDAAGRETAVLFNGELQAGTYNYDFDASQLACGIYFYRLEANDFSQTKKMVLVK